jgi:hypothetical protein
MGGHERGESGVRLRRRIERLRSKYESAVQMACYGRDVAAVGLHAAVTGDGALVGKTKAACRLPMAGEH